MENLFIADNMYKITYNSLLQKLEKYKNKRCKIISFIEIGTILDTFHKIYKDFEINDELRVHFSIGILNIVAHYRHFYSNKLNLPNLIFLYCDTNEKYIKYQQFIKFLEKFIVFIPKTYIITNITDKIPNCGSIMMCNLAEEAIKYNQKIGNNVVFTIMSNNFTDYQIMQFTEDFYVFKPRSMLNPVLDYIDVYKKCLRYRDILSDIEYSLDMRKLFLPHVVIYKQKGVLSTINHSFSNNDMVTRTNKLLFYLQFALERNEYKENYIRYVIKDELLQKECLESLELNDYKYNDELRHYSKIFFKIWNTKLIDNKIYSINDMISFCKDQNIKIEWLMEGR